MERIAPVPAPHPREGVLGQLSLARSTLDRAAERRPDEAMLAAYWSYPDTKVLVVSSGRAAVVDDADTANGTPRLVLTTSYEAPEGERFFLGLDDEGNAYFALAADALPGRMDEDARDAGLREVGALLSDRDAGLMTHAVALEAWHRMNGFCARCGKPTESANGGHVRRCPACGAEHYPRTDPAVIMLVVDDHDRLLLGHQGVWDDRRYSVLAGFVEPGESLEQAVAREVAEESGLTVVEATYLGSQPWPFPCSLMLGYRSHVLDADALKVDGNEIQHARWFTRAELRAAAEAGDVLLPGRISIARHLIEHWYGGRLPESNRW